MSSGTADNSKSLVTNKEKKAFGLLLFLHKSIHSEKKKAAKQRTHAFFVAGRQEIDYNGTRDCVKKGMFRIQIR